MKHFLLISLLALSVSLQAQHTLRFGVELVEATATEKVYNFETEDFLNIVAWQFSMHFDGTRMRFKEIRNPILNYLSTNSFNEPTPGNLRSLWLDNDLTPDNYTEPTVLFQLVFELLTPENTPLCFDEAQEYFEFVVEEGPGNFYLSELVIHDDCVAGLSIFLDGTATEDISTPQVQHVTDVSLQSSGTLSFSSASDQRLKLSLIDLNGRQLISFDEKEYTTGRNSLSCRPVAQGVYVLKTIAGDGKESAMKVFAY